MTLKFADVAEALAPTHDVLKLPRQVSVSQGAAETLVLDDAGGYSGPWDPEEVPYLIEPMDTLAIRKYQAVVFVGPARSGKTAGLGLGWMAHAVVNDPGRMMFMHMTEKKAEMLSKLDVAPAIDASPKLAALKSPFKHDNNIGLRIFKHGMAIRFAWPSRSELAGTTYRYVILTDYDRFPLEQSSGGSIFDLAVKRVATLMSRGMALAESSPEYPITDPRWRPATPHEAPPCEGILSLYNRGDRRRYYWPCPECGEFFQAMPGLENFTLLPDEDDLLQTIRSVNIPKLARELAVVGCPHCGAEIRPDKKRWMNSHKVWLRDGETITADGVRGGNPVESNIASFWLGGVSAVYQSWQSLLEKHLQALREFASTSSEKTLQATANTDQAAPYMSRLLKFERDEVGAESRTEAFPRYIVPAEARFLIVTVDVQGGQDARFSVEVHAHGIQHEQWVIDRYDIRKSRRTGVGDDYAPLDPAAYPEDWELITEKCLKATYRCEGSDLEIRAKAVMVDSGGEDGVTENAYAWWRGLEPELLNRVMLSKGDSDRNRNAPLVRKTKVGGDRPSNGDVTLYLLNPNLFKDAVSMALKRAKAGPGCIHFPEWLSAPYFDELYAEIRMPNGRWKKVRRHNESFDHCYMQRAAAVILGANSINWDDPPGWAKPIESNSDAMTPEDRRQMKREAASQHKTSGFKRSNFW